MMKTVDTRGKSVMNKYTKRPTGR